MNAQKPADLPLTISWFDTAEPKGPALGYLGTHNLGRFYIDRRASARGRERRTRLRSQQVHLGTEWTPSQAL